MVGLTNDFDALLDLCRNHHRRIVLAILAHERRPLTVNDLTTAVAKHNHHAPISELSGAETERLRIALQHTHVPKLEANSLVEYDRERGLVEPTDRFDELEPQLSAVLGASPELETPVTL